MFSTVRGYHDACGGYIEYCGGCSVPWGYHDKCGGYLEYRGCVQYRGGYHEYRSEEENPWETRKKATLKRRLPDYQLTFSSHTANPFEYLSYMETDTDVEPDFFPNHRRTRNIQPQRGSRNQGNHEKSRNYHNQGKKTSQKQIKERTRKRILIIGDSQLHAIDSSKMSELMT